jgi:hypothetical protein
VYVTTLLAATSLPLAFLVPPPQIVVRHSTRLCLGLLLAGCAAMAMAILLPATDHWWEGVGAFAIGLTLLHAMFWCAGVARRRGEDDDSDGGGGGGRRPPHGPDEGPGGSGLDWGEFDRARAAWESERRTVIGV